MRTHPESAWILFDMSGESLEIVYRFQVVGQSDSVIHHQSATFGAGRIYHVLTLILLTYPIAWLNSTGPLFSKPSWLLEVNAALFSPTAAWPRLVA